MIDNGSELIKGQELQSTVESIRNKCLEYHQKFDEQWREKGRISYHNENHIKATLRTTSFLVDAAFNRSFSQDGDPLSLQKDLEEWNNSHPNEKITADEFDRVVQIAFACHDLGNIADLDKEKQIVYLEKYTAKDAEARSVEIAKKIINDSSLGDDQKQRFLPLVKHLIEQTTFQPTDDYKSQPFSIFTRVVDQIGGNLFNDQNIDDIVLGLVEEGVYEKEEFSFTPANFFNFVRQRFPQLINDENQRNKILEIFGKSLPEEIKANKKEVKLKKETLEFLESKDKQLPLMYLRTLLLNDLDYANFILHDLRGLSTALGYVNFKNFNEEQKNNFNEILRIFNNQKQESQQEQNHASLLERGQSSIEALKTIKDKIIKIKTHIENLPGNNFDNLLKNINILLADLDVVCFFIDPSQENLNSLLTDSLDLSVFKSKFNQAEFSSIFQVNKADLIIIYNLLNNAIRYDREGKIKVIKNEDDSISVINDSDSDLPVEGLFTLKGKGKDSKSHTGYGLFIAKFLALVQGKDLIASSEKNANGKYEIKFTLKNK